ncbi:MAG TPA: hypothetical protein PKZ67_03740 [Accumulibacter sp.]|nr:hypothetical protein [Accumulibacter sp.]HNN07770.1 hypothetical protein [Azospira sp.]
MISQGWAWARLRNVLLLLLLFSFCLYLPTLSHYAFADDEIYLAYTNKLLRSAPWCELYRLLVERANPWEFLPVRDLSYWLDFRVFGDDLSGFHLSNLIWYVACCCAVWWLFRELILYCRSGPRQHASVIALAGAVLFALHPAHVESVAWIASRKDLMAGTFGFLSLACTVHGIQCNEKAFVLVLAAGFFLLACFSKAVAIPISLLTIAILHSGCEAVSARERMVRFGATLLVAMLAVFALVIHFSVARDTGIGLDNTPGIPGVLDRASRIQAALIGILLFPYPLQFYYDVFAYGSWHWWVSSLALMAGGIAIVVFIRQRSLWGFGMLLAIIPTTMYLQLSPFTTWSLASERFVFASVAGLALMVTDLFLKFGSPRSILTTMLLVATISAYLVWERVQEWEYGYQMLGREYARRPLFHNAIRDQITFVLLPSKRYAEAEALARQVQRPYAVEVLLALVDAERAYRDFSDASVGGIRSDNPVLQQKFCEAVAAMQLVTREGYAAMTTETDVSYNNILRTLDRFERRRFADAKSICAATIGASSTAPD